MCRKVFSCIFAILFIFMSFAIITEAKDNSDIIVESVKLSEEKKKELIKTFDLKVIEYNRADYEKCWIESFDVSQKEAIAIAFNNSTVLITDKNFNVKYVLAFNCLENEDLFYANWFGENLEIIFYRSNYSFTITPEAELIDVSEKNEKSDGLRNIAQRKSDTVNNTTYKLKTSNAIMALSGSYDMLVRTDLNDEEVVLFKSDKNVPIGMIAWFSFIIVGGAVVMLINIKKTRKNKEV